jgi:transglutaminase-like putative cysteine protease
MLLKITHQTDLTYSDLIHETVMELRMAPRQEQDQHRLSFSLAVGPPTAVTGYFDWLGNTVHAFTINGAHREVKIAATSVVETDRPPRDPTQLYDRWPIEGPPDFALSDYLRFGGAVDDCPKLRDLSRELNPRDGMSLGMLALRVLQLIDQRFLYEKGVTTATSPITDVLDHGRGVCQDFAHLMIGLSRALGIPARYVSGFLHPDRQRYRGYTQTHAWCELHFPSVGWVGFDPTNNCTVNSYFVKLAVGRDYGDVPPNKGLFKGAAAESINVTVHSEELPTVPAGLPAERLRPLPVPVQRAGKLLHPDPAKQQAVQQQQVRNDEQSDYHQQQQQQQQ